MAYIKKEKIESYIVENFSIDKTKNADISFGFLDFLTWLDNTPTADVEKVKHGEWSIAIGYDSQKKVKCSVCELMNYEPTARCPHCGAKMDGGKE